MRRSADKILTSLRVGALPRPLNLPGREAKDYSIRREDLAAAVLEVAKKQAEHGIHIVGDGEFGKSNFLYYVLHQLTGFGERPLRASPTGIRRCPFFSQRIRGSSRNSGAPLAREPGSLLSNVKTPNTVQIPPQQIFQCRNRFLSA